MEPESDNMTDIAAHSLPRSDSHFAGFLIRLAAYTIDSLVMMSPAIAVMLLAPPVAEWTAESGLQVQLASTMLAVLYFAGFHASPWQATPGKRMLGLKVIHRDGSRLTITRALARSLAKLLSYPFFCLGFAMAGWTAEKRALHDMIVSTRVIRTTQ